MELFHSTSYSTLSIHFFYVIHLHNLLHLHIPEFIKSEEGQGFSGQVCIVADSIGSILAYDALCRTVHYQSRHGSENSILDNDVYSHKGERIQSVFITFTLH